ncbi:DUF459 domain-containing protein [Granulicella mallensis]|uniref:SGNH hydrolase-type esterase domain-containing protein n=1 Tax=Granulicella mallensis TaxID=940614 RepID=A0A7W7ZT54_9BACT|nr:DUF459 domain-containing protein [Granulicella mallensis]MBB5065590.1 hypothetical protein [Granulicella mallensis]
MRAYQRFSTLSQLAASVGAFALAALLLESGGLYDWAQRLDLGLERTVAMPVATALHRALAPLHIEQGRRNTLVELARIGWSDDPAALAEANTHTQPKELTPPPVAPSTVTVPLKNTTTVTKPVTPTTATVTIQPVPLRPDAAPGLSTLPAIPSIATGKTRTIALAGDSMMAVGMSSTILRQASLYKNLSFVHAFKSGTGLARPEVFNWQLEYPAMLKEARPDFVLVAIGANDGQGFVEDGVTYPFGSDGWKRIYQRRVQAYLDMLEENGATVIWLGLPPMKSDVYDARIALINRIDYSVVSASPHAIWVGTAGLVGDGSGRFRDYGEIDGHTTRLRQSDGIHLSDDGATLITTKLLRWLAVQEVPKPVAAPVTTAQESTKP